MMYGLMPLFLTALQIFCLKALGGSSVPVVIVILIFAEIMADNWFLGGIQEKNAEKIDYLKTSSRGMKVMESALIMDFARRFLEAAVIFGVCNVISRLFGGEDDFRSVGILLFSILISYSLSVLGTLISRFGSYLWINILTAYIAAAIGIVCCIMLMFGVSAVVLNIIFAVMGTAVSILGIKVAMKRVEEGYYDK